MSGCVFEGAHQGELTRIGVESMQGYQAARLVTLAHLGSLKRALADLDRVSAWLPSLPWSMLRRASIRLHW